MTHGVHASRHATTPMDHAGKSPLFTTLWEIAEMTFPHPSSWRFRWVGSGNIANATVRQLTAALTAQKTTLPTCITSWEARLDDKVLWDTE